MINYQVVNHRTWLIVKQLSAGFHQENPKSRTIDQGESLIIMKKLSTTLYEHLILPVIESFAPVRHVSWGVAIGLFVGLTPTMGIQMYIVAAIWGISRYIFRFQFYLPVGVALVWISNPVTVLPFYYIFLIIGNAFFHMMQWPTIPLDWSTFQQAFEKMAAESLWGMLQEGSRFLVIDLGFPILVGSLFLAIPSAVIFYFVTGFLLTRYRKYRARQANLTYEEWRIRYETIN